MSSPRVISSNKDFRKHYHDLTRGDLIIGILNLSPCEETLFVDLISRGVTFVPSALSQLLSKSKTLQTRIYQDMMLPRTKVIRNRYDLIQAINEYQEARVEKVITKLDRANCGLGIHIWGHVEEVYNQACFGGLNYPFVLQPFVPGIRDIRVIILGDYIEAYWRYNPVNFRNNLYHGGRSGPYELREEELSFCHQAMERGGFPYAHLDLMLLASGDFYLSEISLRGGLKGALISKEEYRRRIEAIHQAYAQRHLSFFASSSRVE
ncbi:ATP-grasp domain-containing protein [Thermosulfuriphilus sp.]